MKPSERIEEIYQSMGAIQQGEVDPVVIGMLKAIRDYLDEEWEKNNECKHNSFNSMTRICEGCGKAV